MCLLGACLAAASLPLWSQAGNAPPQDQEQMPVIQSIRCDGCRRYRQEAILNRISSHAGDPYNVDQLKRDFQALWNTQYFKDITLEVQNAPNDPNQKIVIFHVVERPTIRSIKYNGIHSITESDILDAFKDRHVSLSVESVFDETKITKARVVIQDLEAFHGRQFAVVKATYSPLPATNSVVLNFDVDEGPKVKVGMITFTGNHVFSDRKLIRAMKNSRPYAIPMYLFSIPVAAKTFDQDKLNEDVEAGIRGLYQDNGYFKVVVNNPVLHTVDVHRAGLNTGPIPIPGISRVRGKATNISIAIEEGEQYRMGRLVIRSADPDKGLTLNRARLEALFPLRRGDILNVTKVRDAIQMYTKLYGQFGFIDFTAAPTFDANDATKTIDLTLDFDEQKQYFVRRIDFTGNTTTRDKVIRRELLLSEGDLFNNRYWELSLLRLNQLGYFDKIMPDDAQITRNNQTSTVDILLKLKEKGKQSISLTGGVSGIAGSFIGLGYETNNFLGLGETLSLTGQIGSIEKVAMFSFQEPYLFDRPISTGFSISASQFNFNQAQQESILLGQQIQLNPNLEQNYNTNTYGGTLFASYPLRRFSFSRLGITYGYSVTNIQTFSTSSTDLFELLQFQSLAGPSALNGIRESKIIPSYTYNTVSDPVFPTSGKSIFYSLTFEGLGGNVKALTNTMEIKYFHRVNRHNHVIGLHFLGVFASGYGGLELPPFERTFLGGETDLRGFDIRTVTPIAFIPILTSTTVSYSNPAVLNIFGTPQQSALNVPLRSYQIAFPGGDTSGVVNAEYRIPIVGGGRTVSIDFFGDTGTVGVLQKSELQLTPEGFANLQTGFPNTLNNQLQLASGTNFRLRASAGVELVVQLPIIGAPVRLYWANNFERLSEQIVAPPSSFVSTSLDNIKAVVGPSIYNAQILPQLNSAIINSERINFFEELNTFRFTISRTF